MGFEPMTFAAHVQMLYHWAIKPFRQHFCLVLITFAITFWLQIMTVTSGFLYVTRFKTVKHKNVLAWNAAENVSAFIKHDTHYYSKWYLPLRLIKIHLDCDGTTFNESFLRLGQQKGAGSHGTKRAKILKSSVNKINSHIHCGLHFSLVWAFSI